VDYDGKNLTRLTAGNGTHSLEYSPDQRFYIDTYSKADLPPTHELRKTEDGSLVCELEQADATELIASGRTLPEPFVAKGRDGKTDIYGLIHRPINYNPTHSYPVIEAIYAGPHGAHVSKGFRASPGQWAMADLGFVVVQIDGMGTNWRSKAFHDVCWKNLVDAGFPDRVLWIKAAAKRYPAIDLDRVGIYGGSAGGQNSLGALLTHGDFYRVAVSDCGCHDNRMDKIWWNEQWMGYPIGPHYDAQSNVTLAKNLTGKLLLVVGELDRNVDPASSMQVANALIKADKDFDLLVIPGAGHGATGTAYGKRRLRDYFVEHLLK
jgi:dipeptidyl aminopeptidase/acylaminoacyl peptidase